MSDIRCGTCRWYVPERNPETGRVMPTKGGACEWPWPVPERLPWAIAPGVNGMIRQRRRCYPGSGQNCQTWAERGGEDG